LQSGAIPACEQLLLRLAQPLADRKQPFDFLRAPPRELVQRPGRNCRFAKRFDGLRLIAQPLLPEAPGELVASPREVREREPVELVCRPLDRLCWLNVPGYWSRAPPEVITLPARRRFIGSPNAGASAAAASR
jgi:hypothetical protein